MYKIKIVKWFFPFWVAIAVFLVVAGYNIAESALNLGPLLNGLCVGFYDFFCVLAELIEKIDQYVWLVIIGFLVYLISLIALSVFMVKCVLYAVNLLTVSMGASTETTYHDYYDVKFDDDKISVSQGETTSVTGAGFLRFLMFITYLAWCVPAYVIYSIIYVKKYGR